MTLSRQVRALLAGRIESFEELQILLLLHRDPGSSWTSGAVAAELRVDPAVAAESLDRLCRVELLAVRLDGEAALFRYDPRSPGLQAAVEDLERVYADDLLEVMKAMNANAVERVRTSAMKTFANAFILGDKDRKKDG